MFAKSSAAMFAAAILLFAFASIGGSARAAGSAPTTVATWRFCTNCVDNGGDLSRYKYVGLNAWQYDRVAPLKTSNSAAKALVYKDMASTRSYSCNALIPAGVDYCWAAASHPDWFTTDPNGQRIEWAGFPGSWQMDVGNAAYQSTWVSNVIAELKAKGWDGVVIDNANVDESGYLGGKTMSEYPTQPSYQAATRSFLANVCPQVIAAGFLCLPNIQAQPTLANASLWADWIQFTSGGTREYWMKWNFDASGRYGDAGWNDLQSVFTAVEKAGKIFLPVTYAPMSDVASMRYARASFLMRWDGGASAFLFAPTPEAQDPWSPEWTKEVGTPVGDPVQVGSAWKRAFTGGLVFVNPSSSATATVQFGATYAMPDGSSATSATLPPLSGLVVTSAAATPPPPPPPPSTTPSLSLTAALSGGWVALAWSGARTSNVDLYRNGAKFATSPNSGSYRDRLNKKATGATTYKVCEAGTTVCSPNADVKSGTGAATAALQTRAASGMNSASWRRISTGRTHFSRCPSSLGAWPFSVTFPVGAMTCASATSKSSKLGRGRTSQSRLKLRWARP